MAVDWNKSGLLWSLGSAMVYPFMPSLIIAISSLDETSNEKSACLSYNLVQYNNSLIDAFKSGPLGSFFVISSR